MSKLQRLEDEMYEVAYTSEVLPNCRVCKHHHGQIYGGVELVCAVHPYGYSGDSCPDYQASKKLPKNHKLTTTSIRRYMQIPLGSSHRGVTQTLL